MYFDVLLIDFLNSTRTHQSLFELKKCSLVIFLVILEGNSTEEDEVELKRRFSIFNYNFNRNLSRWHSLRLSDMIPTETWKQTAQWKMQHLEPRRAIAKRRRALGIL